MFFQFNFAIEIFVFGLASVVLVKDEFSAM